MTGRAPRPRLFSGLQPTGKLHVGNYVGALRWWVERQADYDSIFCIADLHALTNPEGLRPDDLRRRVPETAALLLACGIDPARSRLFVQSHVPEHVELAWLLNCVTPVGWVQRMTQFKAKAGERASASMGLLDYPVLQAADSSVLADRAARADVYASPGWRRLQARAQVRPLREPQEGRGLTIDATAVSSFTVGDRVFHQKFGYGRITGAEGDKLDIDFEKAGEKKVVAKFVVPANGGGEDVPF